MRIRIVLASTAIVATMLTPAAAADQGVGCGDVVTADVTMTRDLECESTALYVFAEHPAEITVDLNGHTIRHVGADDGWYAGLEVEGTVTVLDGTVTGFPLDLRGPGYLTLSNVEMGSVNLDGGRLSATRSTIDSLSTTTGSLIVDESRLGRVHATQGVVELTNNRIRGGVWVWGGGRIANNRLDGAGITVRDSNGGLEIVDNRIHRAPAGIRFDGAFSWEGPDADSPIVVRGNRITNSETFAIGDPGRWRTTASIEISDNHITRSGTARDGSAGILFGDDSDAVVTLSGNRVVQSSGHGIYAPGATDGGRNTARAVGASPACVGVVCR